jgi:hypothetical protein
LNRKEAIDLLVELGASQLVSPNIVVVEQKKLDNYQLKIKGNYSIHEIGMLLKNRFSIEEIKSYLIISSL